MSWEPETPQQGGKGSLAPALTDPNDGVRRGPFGNPAKLVQGLPVLDWGKQEGGNPVCKRDLEDPTSDQNCLVSSKAGGVQITGF